jgi:hypothetical protein
VSRPLTIAPFDANGQTDRNLHPPCTWSPLKSLPHARRVLGALKPCLQGGDFDVARDFAAGMDSQLRPRVVWRCEQRKARHNLRAEIATSPDGF